MFDSVKEILLTRKGPLIQASENKPDDLKGQYMTKQDVIANSWIFLFAGHETTANTLHFAFLFLAISLDTQSRLQQDVDTIVGSRLSENWAYDIDMGRLYTSMVGATMNETLRLMPPIIDIPKIVKKHPQPLTIEGKTFMVPTNTFVHINAVGVQRNPRYWPHSSSKVSNKLHDLDDFVPERWLSSIKGSTENHGSQTWTESKDTNVSEPRLMNPATGLFTPVKGAFIPFSEGARACPGRRFAQVEITAVLAVIFQTYTVELDVSDWASDEEVKRMEKHERKAVYEKAMAKARKLIRESETIITLQMLGISVPVRFVKRGEERFMGCYV
jgi:cytochrome P450